MVFQDISFSRLVVTYLLEKYPTASQMEKHGGLFTFAISNNVTYLVISAFGAEHLVKKKEHSQFSKVADFQTNLNGFLL